VKKRRGVIEIPVSYKHAEKRLRQMDLVVGREEMKPGDTLEIDDALNAVKEAVDLLGLARRPGLNDEAAKLIRAAYTLLSLALPVLEEKRP
jgi:hypothetical protein